MPRLMIAWRRKHIALRPVAAQPISWLSPPGCMDVGGSPTHVSQNDWEHWEQDIWLCLNATRMFLELYINGESLHRGQSFLRHHAFMHRHRQKLSTNLGQWWISQQSDVESLPDNAPLTRPKVAANSLGSGTSSMEFWEYLQLACYYRSAAY